MNKTPEVGSLRVWHQPQVGSGAMFYVAVVSVAEGVLIMDTLARYDKFQLDWNIKPDYSNANGLERYEADNGDGVPGWCGWVCEETGEDDPAQWLIDQGACEEL